MDVLQMITQWGGLVVLAGAVCGTIWKVLYPLVKMKKSVDKRLSELSARVDKLETKSFNDYNSMLRSGETDRAVLKALFAILAHLEDQNHFGLIRDAQESLKTFLVEKI